MDQINIIKCFVRLLLIFSVQYHARSEIDLPVSVKYEGKTGIAGYYCQVKIVELGNLHRNRER